MKQETSQSEQGADFDQDLMRRRAALVTAFQALPTYGSAEFWGLVEESQVKLALPLEILVKCARIAIAQEDSASRNRIFEMIFRRTQGANEYWSRQILDRIQLTSYERKHVYQAFMTREGRWYNQHANEAVTRRVPCALIGSLDQPVQHANGETWEMDIEDEQAQQALLSVEQRDLLLLILHLPEKLKPVIWLIFWEGRTEKNVANILGVSDRTVRNRLQKALKLLRTLIETEGKNSDE